ncbi:ubiquitin domain-containing protein 1 [Capsaspora owczarzaki ATCC 30864]|uniref:Ubiquitin domain-containing protein 1 n=1 Tax=Capsaspora owczarzaki (strain ATCC 30864) TaxID=595528 RepID=A0A0D2X5G6_CAPO3|nr:ubiquitin domain-containing protein 1 [Capsaspora owczarzaki ATCC 30864]KJE97774.1 ubiquitin domain-containing protein 1 [Capsaspora owczarzaki ATCC 30864]|eukprot:XP_004342961.2 ubiquitin domain-containing protein 1 [Capsaspora owczarzaki ATCC 30864]
MGNCLGGSSGGGGGGRPLSPQQQQLQQQRQQQQHQQHQMRQGIPGGRAPAARQGEVVFGRNQPLERQPPSWAAEVHVNRAMLAHKREEFWSTAPEFGGQREIWQALKGAAETSDHALAQAIVDGAGISLPLGQLTDAYDERGYKYTVPLFCLSDPSNLAADDQPDPANAIALDTQRTLDKTLRLRLSTMKDVKLPYNDQDTVLELKHRLAAAENIPVASQRFFMSGKEFADRTVIGLVSVPQGFVIQVLVRAAAP